MQYPYSALQLFNLNNKSGIPAHSGGTLARRSRGTSFRRSSRGTSLWQSEFELQAHSEGCPFATHFADKPVEENAQNLELPPWKCFKSWLGLFISWFQNFYTHHVYVYVSVNTANIYLIYIYIILYPAKRHAVATSLYKPSVSVRWLAKGGPAVESLPCALHSCHRRLLPDLAPLVEPSSCLSSERLLQTASIKIFNHTVLH